MLGAKLLHGGGPNRSAGPRRNLISQWSGPGNPLVTPEREVYTGLMPRSVNADRRAQFRHVFADCGALTP